MTHHVERLCDLGGLTEAERNEFRFAVGFLLVAFGDRFPAAGVSCRYEMRFERGALVFHGLYDGQGRHITPAEMLQAIGAAARAPGGGGPAAGGLASG
jgi:hypothetical protein